MELLYQFCFGLTTVLGIGQALFVLYQDPDSRVNVTWSMMNLCVAVWALSLSMSIFAPDPKRALEAARISQYTVIWITILFNHFCLALVGMPLGKSRLGVFGYGFALAMLPVFWTPLFVASVSPKLIFRHYINPGPLYAVYLTQFFSFVFYGHWLLLRHLKSQPPERRNQIKWVASATLIGFVCGSSGFLLVYDIPVNPLPVLFVPGYALMITYAIVRHHLMDIRVVITRTAVLVGTYLVVLGVPFVLGWWGRPWLEHRIGQEWWLVPVGLCTVLATAGPFAYASLRRQAERRLLKEQRRYQRTLQLAARGMTQVRNVTKLATLITRLVSRAVGMTHASLFLWDRERERYLLRASHGLKRLAPQSRYALVASHPLVAWFQHNRRIMAQSDLTPATAPAIAQELQHLGAELVIPGFIEHRLIGLLVLGPKLAGVGYSTDDLYAFATLANEAAIAVENALSYEELLKVNEQLKAASERLLSQERLAAAGQFATGMAHEIKNPLSAIKTFAQYLPEKYKDPAFREKFFRIVQDEIDRINTIVKELSDFAKPAPLQLQPVRLPELVEDTLSLLSNQCLKQHVVVQTAFGENGLTIQGDPQQLKQVLLNLFLNSLEAMGQGGRLEVSSRVNGRTVTLRIADSGCGIEPRHLADVWDPFFTTKERGMGLGLAIVKGIIERHGGAIRLTSPPGQGTAVEVSLPLSPQGKPTR